MPQQDQSCRKFERSSRNTSALHEWVHTALGQPHMCIYFFSGINEVWGFSAGWNVGYTVLDYQLALIPGHLSQKKEDGSLNITVYRKPSHTDHYLDFQSHHPPHVKRDLVKCLYDRARGITSTQDNLQKEEHHLSKVLRWNVYLICSAAWPPQCEEDAQDSLSDEGISPPLVMLPYTAGVSMDIRWVCRKYGMKVIFRSGLSLRSVLTQVKDPLPMGKQSKVVYRIPCSCSKKIGDEVEGAPGSLQERDTGEVCSSWTCMEGPTHHQVGGDQSGWHGQTSQWTASRKPSTSTWPLLRNASTGTQDFSSLDAAWLSWENGKAEPTGLMDLSQILRTSMTANDAVYGHKNDAFPLCDIFTLKKTGASRSKCLCVLPCFQAGKWELCIPVMKLIHFSLDATYSYTLHLEESSSNNRLAQLDFPVSVTVSTLVENVEERALST